MNTAKEMARFNATNLTGMKEIMVKAHALAKLTRMTSETYANAFRRCLKLVWRKIKRADTMGNHVFLYSTGNKEHPYDFVHTKLTYLHARKYFDMLKETECVKESVLNELQEDDFCYDTDCTKQDLIEVSKDYIVNYYPQLIRLVRYDTTLGYDGYQIQMKELERLLENNFYSARHDLKPWLKKFVSDYVFGVKCRIHVFMKSYCMKD